jgi:peptidoglycan/xylan/chitin deacetylase (PgdA/CDA1 family)
MKRINRVAASLMWPTTIAVDRISAAPMLTLVGWHRIDAGSTGLSTSFDDFRRHLDVLQEWGARVLPLRDAVRLLAAGELPPRAVALTFDDGYASVLELAWPELLRRGLPATLFAVSGYLDATRRLPWDRHHAESEDSVRLASAAMVRESAAAGLDIGSHTVSHRWLPTATADEIKDEVTASKTALEDLLGDPVTGFAYPMGGWTPAVRDAVAAAGYELAVTCDRGRTPRGHDPLLLRRAFAFDRFQDFRMQLDGAYTWMRPIEDWRMRRESR